MRVSKGTKSAHLQLLRAGPPLRGVGAQNTGSGLEPRPDADPTPSQTPSLQGLSSQDEFKWVILETYEK